MEKSIDLIEPRNNTTEGIKECRYCWVCFSTEDDDKAASWVHPCTCRGSTKWVHQLCLQRWVDEKQEGNLMGKVFCPQCNMEYIIVFPEISPFIFLLGLIDRAVKKICPFVAAGILISALHWIAVTFGAVTLLQVLGNKDSLKDQGDPLAKFIGLPAMPIVVRLIGTKERLTAIEQADLSINLHALLISLPIIPLILIFSKMISWEDPLLALLQKYSTKLPFLKHIVPSFVLSSEEAMRSNIMTETEAPSMSGIFCGALFLPTIASICGNFLFEPIQSNLLRATLGGLTFVIIKGCLRIYYKQQLFVRQNKKVILDYIPPNKENSHLTTG